MNGEYVFMFKKKSDSSLSLLQQNKNNFEDILKHPYFLKYEKMIYKLKNPINPNEINTISRPILSYSTGEIEIDGSQLEIHGKKTVKYITRIFLDNGDIEINGLYNDNINDNMDNILSKQLLTNHLILETNKFYVPINIGDISISEDDEKIKRMNVFVSIYIYQHNMKSLLNKILRNENSILQEERIKTIFYFLEISETFKDLYNFDLNYPFDISFLKKYQTIKDQISLINKNEIEKLVDIKTLKYNEVIKQLNPTIDLPINQKNAIILLIMERNFKNFLSIYYFTINDLYENGKNSIFISTLENYFIYNINKKCSIPIPIEINTNLSDNNLYKLSFCKLIK
jgi:hypothetical protein